MKLNEKIENPLFINEFENKIDNLDEEKLKELIKKHY